LVSDLVQLKIMILFGLHNQEIILSLSFSVKKIELVGTRINGINCVMMKMISIRIGFEKIHSIDIYKSNIKKIIFLTILTR